MSSARPRCALFARRQGIDPVGWAPSPAGYLIVELPLPWARDEFDRTDDLRRVRKAGEQAWQQGHQIRLLAIAPDPQYSEPGRTRVLRFIKPEGPFARFQREEYLIPTADASDFCVMLLEGTEVPPTAPTAPAGSGVARDFLVCTHGMHDACCAKFGYPVFRALRDLDTAVRVWRVSHIGGDRFAATALDLPEGRYWAHLDPVVGARILDRRCSVTEVAPHYRGWAGLSSRFEQAVEREMFLLVGWEWVNYHKTGRILEVDDDEQRARVRIDYSCTDGQDHGAYEATVEVGRYVLAPACGMFPEEANQRVPEVRVTHIRRVL